MNLLVTMVVPLYTVVLLVLGVYAGRTALHLLLWRRQRGHRAPGRSPLGADRRSTHDDAPDVRWRPHVTVQLPIYNEGQVAARAIAAACALRWPRERFEVQVLDDSTDGTRAIVDAAAAEAMASGTLVQVMRRTHRAGFKGGALAAGTARARGELLAVLDADFVPERDWLLRLTPRFLSDERIGCVQSRWAHLNAMRSALTSAQALALDGYFVVEQEARAGAGLALNFNGSGGIWRARAIAAAGGWRGGTLCEDVDLSYRAQLSGWRIDYCDAVSVPGELPATMLAFKRQQARWARGTAQNLRRLAGRIARSRWPMGKRVHALLSLSAHIVQPLLVALLLGAPALIVLRPELHPVLLIPTLLSLGQPGLIATAQRKLHGAGWWRRMRHFPALSVLGAGMTVNGSLAVALGLFGPPGTFERTPKEGSTSRLRASLLQTASELGLALWSIWALLLALQQGAWGSLPFLLIFALGYLWVGGASLRAPARMAPEAPPRGRRKAALEPGPYEQVAEG